MSVHSFGYSATRSSKVRTMEDQNDARGSGRKWRVLAHRGAERIELEDQGTFDELVLDDWMHIERMEDNVWWLRVGDARISVALLSGEAPTVDVCRGAYAPAKGTTTTQE